MATAINFSAEMEDGFVCLSAKGEPATDAEVAIAKDKMLAEHKVREREPVDGVFHIWRLINVFASFFHCCRGNRAQFMLDLREEFIRDHDALLALSTHGPV